MVGGSMWSNTAMTAKKLQIETDTFGETFYYNKIHRPFRELIRSNNVTSEHYLIRLLECINC